MNRLFLSLVVVAVMTAGAIGLHGADAPAPARPEPTLEQRVADLEAYVNNTARVADSTNNVSSKLGSYDPKTNSYEPAPGPGHNGWMMTSAALVLFMTLPGLFLFYGGLVRRKNVLSVIAQCFGIAGLVTILWVVFGYSTVFSGSGAANKEDFIKGVVGSYTANGMLDGVTSAPNTNYGGWVSQNVFSMYQLMFAIITPALILGAVAERIKFSALLLFVALWMILVYFPLAHMVWGITGMMNGVF